MVHRSGGAQPLTPAPPLTKRYRVEGELGRGGMGAVYRAIEVSSGREVALKTLATSDPRSAMLFEREYHVLASLKHPSVIDVFDFGVSDDGQRYYTMEILPGDDLSALSPLPWNQACAAVRDVATSLALLHARRFVHRDVSPRNVRLDSAGRAKLLDFGALASFGVSTEIVGTPMCIAPEVARQVDLDQRSDLFSLGVVLYLALTGRRPFPVRSLHDVEAAHAVRPPPPSEVVKEVPRALDALVLAMLSIDPIGRPSTAAEVIDRLSAIAELDEEPLTQLASSHLLSTALCGRDREKAQLNQHVARTVRGQGSVVIIEGTAGVGRSRLAGELLIDARLAGMTTLRVDAMAHSEAHGVMRALARLLLETSPAEATETLSTHLPVLAHALPELRTYARPEDAPLPPSEMPDNVGERRSRVQEEFVKWVLQVAKRKPLLLVIDDVEATDPTSAGVLIGLAHAARGTRLLLAVTQRSQAELSVAVAQLSRVGARIKLRPLTEEAIDQLVASAFGDVPHRNRLTHWLFAVSHGNPSQSLALLSHLVSTEVIRYAGGAWVLPPELSERDLPTSVEDTLRARVDALSPTARQIAELLAVQQGALDIDVIVALLPKVERSDLFAALEELLTRDIANASDVTYRLRQESLRPVLLGRLNKEQVTALHYALGNALFERCKVAVASAEATSQATPAELGLVLQTGFHFLKGGDETRGRRLLRDAGIELTHRGDGLAEAIPALEAALAIYQQQGRHDGDAMALMVPLTLAGSYVDFRLAYRYGERLMKELVTATGLLRAARWSRILPRSVALWSGIVISAIGYPFGPYREAARSFREMILAVISLGTAVIGAATPLLDRGLAARNAKLLAPLGWFPTKHVAHFVYGFMLAMVDSTHGRFAEARRRGRHALSLLRKPGSIAGLPEDARVQLDFGLQLLLGSLDAYRTDGSVHETLQSLDSQKTSVSRQTAAGVRATYHANRGERALFDQHQREVDVLAAQAGSTWRQDVLLARNLWWPAALCEDVMGLKHCVRQLEAFAAEAPSLSDNRDAAHACYLAERGMHAEALEKYEATLTKAAREPGELSMRFVGALARLYRKTGQYDRAEALCRQAISALTPEQLEFEAVVAGVQIEHVLALASLGRQSEAIDLLEQLRALQERHDNPLVRGLTHKAWAWIALQQKDSETFRVHLDAMLSWFRRTDNPALIAQCRSLADEGRRRDQLTDTRRYSLAPTEAALTGVTAVRSAFGLCRGPADRVQTALDLVISATRAQRGHLYVMEPTGLRLAAPLVGVEPPEELRVELQHRLNSFRDSDDKTAVTDNTKIGRLQTAIANDDADTSLDLIGGTYRSLFLLVPRGGELVAVGAIALVAGEEGIRPMDFALLEEISRGIYDAGDVQTVYFEARATLPPPGQAPQNPGSNKQRMA